MLRGWGTRLPALWLLYGLRVSCLELGQWRQRWLLGALFSANALGDSKCLILGRFAK